MVGTQSHTQPRAGHYTWGTSGAARHIRQLGHGLTKTSSVINFKIFMSVHFTNSCALEMHSKSKCISVHDSIVAHIHPLAFVTTADWSITRHGCKHFPPVQHSSEDLAVRRHRACAATPAVQSRAVSEPPRAPWLTYRTTFPYTLTRSATRYGSKERFWF